jgi:hypothetical protein
LPGEVFDGHDIFYVKSNLFVLVRLMPHFADA